MLSFIFTLGWLSFNIPGPHRACSDGHGVVLGHAGIGSGDPMAPMTINIEITSMICTIRPELTAKEEGKTRSAIFV